MRRKLIKHEIFEQLAKNSAKSVEKELTEAQDVLAKSLGKDDLKLSHFNDSTAIYETLDDTYVYSAYEIKNENIEFSNIEELIVDEDSKVAKRQEIVAKTLEAILVDDSARAKESFREYFEVYSFDEAKKFIIKKAEGEEGNDFNAHETEDKPEEKGKFPKKLSFKAKRDAKASKEKNKKFSFGGKSKNEDKFKNIFKKKLKSAGKKVEESYITAENALGYVDYIKFGPVLAEVNAETDKDNNIVSVSIPAIKARNESKIQSADWKIVNQKIKNFREAAFDLVENQAFCKAVAELKKMNAVSENLQETLENIVRAYPTILYTSQGELAKVIDEALKVANVKNYDDQTCEFMAEAILRTAYQTYADKVKHIASMASAQKVDSYEDFQKVAEQFYPSVDQKFNLEKKVFADLYECLEDIYRSADRRDDKALKQTTAGYLNELAKVLNNEVRPEVAIVEDVANWLKMFIETNLEMSNWDVSNTPHITVTGDHPDMAKKAAKGYSPSADFSGDWGDPAPMIGQDDNNYKGKHSKEARSNSWGNFDKDTFPNLDNPYIPKPFGDYTMKGEKGADKETDTSGMWDSDDTWPKLQNPYAPKSETPYTYKMNQGKETDTVVDK